jgi:Zn finger protein HypA/HybF involved in hydrogenase expression
MATGHVTVGVVTELVDHDHGHWCNACMLATGIRAYVAIRVGTGRMSLQTRIYCTECGSRDIEVDPDARHC